MFSDSQRKMNSEYTRLLCFCLSESLFFLEKCHLFTSFLRFANSRNSAKARWDKTGMVVEKLPFKQYCIKITGSGCMVLHNCKFIKEIPLSTNQSFIPSPLHNHPEIQYSLDIQSEHTSSEVPNEPQNEPNVAYHDTPLIKLPRVLPRD